MYLQLEIYIHLQLEIYIYLQLEIETYLQLEIEIQIVSKNVILQTSSDFLLSKETKGKRYVSSCKKHAARDISSNIYTSSDIYLQQEINIYLQLDRHISPARDIHLDCIQKFHIVDIIFVLNFQWLKLSNRRYSLNSYVFFQQEIDI